METSIPHSCISLAYTSIAGHIPDNFNLGFGNDLINQCEILASHLSSVQLRIAISYPNFDDVIQPYGTSFG
jgi:hypothetical protein